MGYRMYMTLNSSIIIGTIVIMLLGSGYGAAAFAGGPRLDSGDDVTAEEHDCWVNGFDAGFAGKYDSDRARECLENGDDAYNESWDNACEYADRTEECIEIMNNPVVIEDHEALEQENKQSCRNDGKNDAEANNPYDKDRANGCSEYGGYRDGYQFACQRDNTESSCELLISGEKSYCPNHPDITACVEFLHNATNKKPAESGTCAGLGDPRPQFTCYKEQSPEKYCLAHDDPAFCKTIGDLCDPDGFVKPEYPYCTTN